jgi:hypothetical protein
LDGIPIRLAAVKKNNRIIFFHLNGRIEIVKSILTAFSSLLPLRRLRNSDGHDRAIELTAVALHLSAGQQFEIVAKSFVLFFMFLSIEFLISSMSDTVTTFKS